MSINPPNLKSLSVISSLKDAIKNLEEIRTWFARMAKVGGVASGNDIPESSGSGTSTSVFQRATIPAPPQNLSEYRKLTNEVFSACRFTPEGGFATLLINKTGASSIKGTAVCPSETDDFAVQVQDAGFDSMGIVYDDAVADGENIYVVTTGPADVLIRDNVAVNRRDLLVADVQNPGRAIPIPRLEDGSGLWVPYQMTVNAGVLDSGTVEALIDEDSDVVQIDEEMATPGFQVDFDFTVYEIPVSFRIHGYYAGILGHTVNVDIYNYNTASWDNLGTLPDDTAEQEYTFSGVTADHVDGESMQVRIDHVSPGNATHNLFLNRMGFLGNVSTHFMEYGHALESKAGGTDVLVRAAIHFN